MSVQSGCGKFSLGTRNSTHANYTYFEQQTTAELGYYCIKLVPVKISQDGVRL
jgi:hypothetical protein